MAAVDDGTFETTDNITVPQHPAKMWETRFPDDDRDVADVWRQSLPVSSRRAPLHSALYARICPESAALLLVHGSTLLTALYASAEPAVEQAQFVRNVRTLDWRVLGEQARRRRVGVLPDPSDAHPDGEFQGAAFHTLGGA